MPPSSVIHAAPPLQLERPRSAHPSTLATCWVALPLGMLCLLGGSVLGRAGYSPDEEITAVVVQAVSTTGMPLLPSGILYHRGVPYTYLVWIISTVFGHSVAVGRAASLLCGLAALPTAT